MSERFDLIVIGGGSAARDAASQAARKHGARVALVERERWGGSCPNVACKPTKAYLVAAELVRDVNILAQRIGVDTGPASVDLARVRAWKETLKKSQDQWVAELMGAGFATYTAEASLVDAHTVKFGGNMLRSQNNIFNIRNEVIGPFQFNGRFTKDGMADFRSTGSRTSPGSTTSPRSSWTSCLARCSSSGPALSGSSSARSSPASARR